MPVHIHLIDRLAVANGILSGLALFPQVFKVIASGDIGGISLVTSFMLWVNSIIWLIYALHRGLISIAISSALNFIATTLLLGMLTILSVR